MNPTRLITHLVGFDQISDVREVFGGEDKSHVPLDAGEDLLQVGVLL